MSHKIVQIEGINIHSLENGDIKVVLHLSDLQRSLSTIPTLNNQTHVLLSTKRSTLSAKGHTHNKPSAKVWLSNPEQEKSST